MNACVGSGYCCSKSLCYPGLLEHGGVDPPCPSLRFDGKRHRCGVYEAALRGEWCQDAWWVGDMLAIGAGCCSGLNSARGPYLTGDGEKEIFAQETPSPEH